MDNRIVNETDNINDIVNMLDTMTQTGVSRIKVETSGEVMEGHMQKAYHHGRCDVGSPFATGKLFDLEEDSGKESSKF